MARVLNGGGYMTVATSVWRITDETRDTETKTHWRNLIVEVKPPAGGHEWRWSKNERGEDENEDARDANEKIDGRARIGTFARQECTYIDDLLSGRVDFSITTPNVFRLQTLTEWLAHARTVWNPVFSGSRTAGAAECGVPEWWFLNEELPPSRGVATLPITVSTPPATTTSYQPWNRSPMSHSAGGNTALEFMRMLASTSNLVPEAPQSIAAPARRGQAHALELLAMAGLILPYNPFNAPEPSPAAIDPSAQSFVHNGLSFEDAIRAQQQRQLDADAEDAARARADSERAARVAARPAAVQAGLDTASAAMRERFPDFNAANPDHATVLRFNINGEQTNFFYNGREFTEVVDEQRAQTHEQAAQEIDTNSGTYSWNPSDDENHVDDMPPLSSGLEVWALQNRMAPRGPLRHPEHTYEFQCVGNQMSHIATLPNRKVVFTTQQGVVLMLNFSEQGSLERAYDSRLTPQWGEIFEPSGIYGVHYVETHDNLDVVALVVGAARLHMRLIFIDSRTGDRVNTPRQIYKFDSNDEGHRLIADTTRMTITGVTSFHQNACLAIVVSDTEHSNIFVLDKVVHIVTQPTWKPRVCVTFDRVVSAVATNAEYGLVGVLVQASRVSDAPVGMTVSGSRIDIKLPISTNSFFMDFNATSELGFVNLPYVFTSCLRTGPRYADITAVSPTGDIISVELASSSPTTVGTSLPTSSPANRVGLITATSHTGFPVHFATPVKISCATAESHRLVALVANTLQVFTRAYALQPFEFEFSMTLEPSDHITTLHMLDGRTIMLHTRTGIKFIKI